MSRTVLLIDAFAEEGGAEVVLRTYVRYLSTSSFRPVVVFLSPGPFAAQLRSLGVRVYVLPRHRRRHVGKVLRAILAITAIARRENVGIIHSNGFGPHLYGSLAAVLAGCRKVWQIHDPPVASSWRDAVVRWLYLRLPTSRYVFNADVTRDVFLQHKRVANPVLLYPASDRIQLGMEPPMSVMDVKRRFSLDMNARIVLMLARLQPTKGHETLLAAAPLVLEAFPETRFLVVGASLFGLHEEYGRTIQEAVCKMGLADKVTFTGFCDDGTVCSLLFACEMLAHPAFGEPFGLVVTEAMMAAKPVVASRVEGPARIVVDAMTGLLVEPGDANALAAAIRWMLEHREEARVMGLRGQARAMALYSPATLVASLEALYIELSKPE